MNNYVKGIYRKSIYKNDKGYIIGILKVIDTNIDEISDYVNRTITFTGSFAELNENDKYLMYGQCVVHPKYGFQYSVSSYERLKPDDSESIAEFLSSDLFKGIGKKQATSIVNILGNNALDKILEDKNCLYQVPRLSEKKINIIYDSLIKYEESHNIIIKLNELGFSTKESLSIYNKYKSNTINVIDNNIYRIIDDINEISFSKLDSIALNIISDKYDIERIKHCIIFIMNELCFRNGDVYLSYSEIYNGLTSYLKTDIDNLLFEEALESLKDELGIVVEEDRYYLIDNYESEEYIAHRLYELINKKTLKYKDIDSKLKQIEEENQISYSDKQKEAIIKAIENNVLIITGGPGTGKTTIIKAITLLYKSINKLNTSDFLDRVALLAPTGRASKRISEFTNIPATTIHRFLKWNKESNEFMVNEYNPDYSNLIIIDEMSMVDNKLMCSLLKGLTSNIKLVLVGDCDQLPSVGIGNLLKDLIDSDVIDVVKLDLLYRQDEFSYIPVLANEIKNDLVDEEILLEKDDYKFLTCSNDMILPSLVNICKKIISKGYNYKSVQLMAPMYAGINGIDNINKILQGVFNPPDIDRNELRYDDIIYRENDKVLQLVNDPDNNVFNGDIGFIREISYENSSPKITIDYDGTIVTYDQKDFVKFKHGYIISIHKSQGSEFDIVILPISNSYRRMLYKKLIYTAVTRAKKKLIVIGEAQTFLYSIKNNNEYNRKTTLLDRILNILNKK